MSYVDVERSAEALQEDEELIEAVEHLVETAATSLKSEILQTIEDIWQYIISWLEWFFPVWVDYREDQSLFWEDLNKLALFAILFIISFLILAPSSSQKKKRRKSAWGYFGKTRGRFPFLKRPTLPRRTSIADFDSVKIQARLHESHPSIYAQKDQSSATICSGRVIAAEEQETDVERFEKNYYDIRMSSYRRLVLPPECKLVEKPKRPPPAKEASSKIDDQKKQKKVNDDDHPAKRLHMYLQNLWSLIKSFIYYDYMGIGWTLIQWLQTFLRIREYRRSGSRADLVEDDDDDDDESKASASVASVKHSTTGNNNLHAPLTPEHSFRSSHNMEEKKESPYRSMENHEIHTPPTKMTITTLPNGMNHGKDDNYNSFRRSSDLSILSTPTQFDSKEEVGESDEASLPSLKMPLSANLSAKPQGTTVARPSLLGGKKKDLLDNYRSASNNPILGQSSSNRANTSSQNTSTTSQSTAASSLTHLNNNSMSHSLAHSSSMGSDDTTVTRNHISDDNSTIGDPCDLNDMHPIPETSRMQRLDSEHSAYFFETANTKESLYRMSLEAPIPDKHGYIVGDEFLPESNCTPLLVFVNSRSGPQQGHLLIAQLRRLLNPVQVWDLGIDGDPKNIVESFCSGFRNLRILVCGGDGTVAWIIATLENMNLQRKWPPIAILPLGTGNDLARIHGWGGGYNNESLIGILEQVADSYISLLDRWEMTIENRKGKVKGVKSFFNYLGVGADAQAALQVHMLRESKPQLFFSRVVNKLWYGVFGAEDIIKATSVNLPSEITLVADGVEIPLPPDSQGIILLNIDSYAGGVPMWANGNKSVSGLHGYNYSTSDVGSRGPGSRHQPGHLRRTRSLEDLGVRRHDMDRIDSSEDLTQMLTDDQKYERVTACNMPSSCQDGILDVISIRGAFHLGQIRVGLSNAQRICQCREVTIHIKRKVAVQIDGEPWRQSVCSLKVKRKPDSAIMLHRSEDENGVETEMAKLLDWAEERRLINNNVHYTLMKEFSRRIESKTRQRRHKSQDNVLFSLKRAIGSSGAISSYGNYEYP